MPWLISGATLAQHDPFDYRAFVDQLFATGATVTALPPPILAELAKDGGGCAAPSAACGGSARCGRCPS